jgi:hypothetical protein
MSNSALCAIVTAIAVITCNSAVLAYSITFGLKNVVAPYSDAMARYLKPWITQLPFHI